MAHTRPRRLYRDDSYLTRFTASVTRIDPHPDGTFWVELDRTAFYPTGGGQPHDMGRLAGHAVLDVKEGPEGRILHQVQAPEPLSGSVEAEIDWPRRFDHMQQHTGQHILSRAFVEVAGAPTRSFHLGESACTIDLDAVETTPEAIRMAEARANEIIFGDNDVEVELVAFSQAPQLAADMTLMRELALKPGDPIRIVKIGSFDETPCGGTHVRRAGEVGAVVVRSWERFKGGTRVCFLCGGRVVTSFAEMASVVDACVGRLSTPPADLDGAIGRLQSQVAEARRTASLLNEALVGAEALARDASARAAGTFRVIVEAFNDRPLDDLQLLAQKYTASSGRIALLASSSSATDKSSLVFARSDEGAPPDLKMGEILLAVCAPRGGKGGGGATLARGGGIPASMAEAALEEAFGIVASRLVS